MLHTEVIHLLSGAHQPSICNVSPSINTLARLHHWFIVCNYQWLTNMCLGIISLFLCIRKWITINPHSNSVWSSLWSNLPKSTCNSHILSFSDVWEMRWAFSSGLESLSSIISCFQWTADHLWKSLSLQVMLQYLSQTISRPRMILWGMNALQELECHLYRGLESGRSDILQILFVVYN